MTTRLYQPDPMVIDFTARLLSCREREGNWEVVLDRSAFFPEGGGQPGDQGILGGRRVLDTREREGEIVHLCDGPVDGDGPVYGHVDPEVRCARMQIHTGEHIVSGTAHREWGCENVGFHMTEHAAVLDFDRELDARQLAALERMANRAIWDDLPIHQIYPTPEQLAELTFRQKKELTGQIRLIEIPGVDLCACCAPHVYSTGRIGLIVFTDVMRHRGGMRITMTAGRAAYENDVSLRREAGELSRLFSAPQGELSAAAERLLGQQEAREAARADLERRYCALLAGSAAATEGNIAVFESGELSAAALRTLAGVLAEKCGGVAGAFAGEDGAWRYVLASKSMDLRGWGKGFNAALRGRGGGAPGMIQGSVGADRHAIEEYFHHGEN